MVTTKMTADTEATGVFKDNWFALLTRYATHDGFLFSRPQSANGKATLSNAMTIVH